MKTFSKKEMQEFDKFIRSPFFNNHSTVIKVFSVLKKFHPKFDNKDLTKEYIFKHVNKSKEFDDVVFRKYFSRLYLLAENYLNMIEVLNQKESNELNILNQLSKRNIPDLLEKKSASAQKNIFSNLKLHEDYFLNQHKLKDIKFYESTKKYDIENTISILDESFKNLFTYFIFKSDTIFNQIYSYNLTYKTDSNLNILEYLMKSINVSTYINKLKEIKDPESEKQILFLELSVYANDLKNKNKHQAYLSLKKTLFDNKDKLDDELIYFYLCRINEFCTYEKINGNTKYLKDQFEYFKFILENEYYSFDGNLKMTFHEYRNILFVAFLNSEFKWVKNFINEYSVLFNNNPEMKIPEYSNAHLLFYENKYISSLKILTKINPDSFVISFDIYYLKAKIFYELNYFDSANSLSDTFRHFIKSNKLISNNNIISALNFLKYYNKILSIKKSGDNKNCPKNILLEIKKQKNLRSKEWLIEKAEELLKS